MTNFLKMCNKKEHFKPRLQKKIEHSDMNYDNMDVLQVLRNRIDYINLHQQLERSPSESFKEEYSTYLQTRSQDNIRMLDCNLLILIHYIKLQ